MNGTEFEQDIRKDMADRIVRVLRDNLVLNSPNGLNWLLRNDQLGREIRTLRERLHPGKEPSVYAPQAPPSQEQPSGVPHVQAAQAPTEARRKRTVAHSRPKKAKRVA